MSIVLSLYVFCSMVMITCDAPQQNEHALYGYLSAYNKLPTDATIAYREEIGDIPRDSLKQYDVLVATLDCGLIGKHGVLMAGKRRFTALVFDCAGDDGGHTWMKDKNIVAEVDWYFWNEFPELIGKRATIVIGGNNHPPPYQVPSYMRNKKGRGKLPLPF